VTLTVWSKVDDFHFIWKHVCYYLLVISSNLSPFPRYGHLELKTFRWKLRPNRCRWRHGYYWQPIGSRQRPIRWYHHRPCTIYHLATIHPWQTYDDHANSSTVAQVRSAKNAHYHTRWWSVCKPHHRPDFDHAKCYGDSCMGMTTSDWGRG